MSKFSPGTSKTMAIKGAACGIRPDLDEMTADTGFDFSNAVQFLPETQANAVATADADTHDADTPEADTPKADKKDGK